MITQLCRPSASVLGVERTSPNIRRPEKEAESEGGVNGQTDRSPMTNTRETRTKNSETIDGLSRNQGRLSPPRGYVRTCDKSRFDTGPGMNPTGDSNPCREVKGMGRICGRMKWSGSFRLEPLTSLWSSGALSGGNRKGGSRE